MLRICVTSKQKTGFSVLILKVPFYIYIFKILKQNFGTNTLTYFLMVKK